MFESYEIKEPAFRSEDFKRKKFLKVEIIDSTFKEETTAAVDDDGALNIMSAIITVYEDKELNVAANVAKAYIYMCKRFNIEPKLFIKRLVFINKDVAKYKEDIEKYLSLL